MKYVVAVNGEKHEVSLDGDGVRFGGELLQVALEDPEGTPVRVLTIGNEVHRVVVQRREGRGTYTLWVDGYRFEVEALDERTRAIREMTASTAGPAGPAPVKAPMPGLVLRINVKIGDQIAAGHPVAVMEAMKMENELRSVGPGRVRAILVQPGTAVEKGTLLVELE